MEFTEWLEQELKNRRWTPSDLANQAGLGNSTVTRILNKDRNPGPDFCRAIAKALGQPEELVFRQAGLLSPLAGDEDEITLKRLYEIARSLPRKERAELLWYADARFKRWSQERNEQNDQNLPANADV